MNFLSIFLRGVGLLPSVIQGVESLFGPQGGPQKKQAALDIAGAAINVVEALANKQIVDGPAFNDGLGKIVDGVVACMNASVWHKS